MRTWPRIPFFYPTVEVVRHLSDGDVEAWRGRITEPSYDEW